MHVAGLRSPYEKVGGLYYFGRMLDKIRLHARGELPGTYAEQLGTGFDGRCARLLHVNYAELVDRVALDPERHAADGNIAKDDEEILRWCHVRGYSPTDEEIEVWNEFMRKRGWNDDDSARVRRRLEETGYGDRKDIETMFDFIDLDEGREPHDWSQKAEMQKSD